MVSIIIVTLNSASCINECLKSVSSQTVKDYEIIAVDNGSADNTVKILKSFHLPIRLIENRNNMGFAKANNQAISLSKSDYLVLLNPDVVMKEKYIEELLTQIQTEKKIGAVTGKLLRKKSSHEANDIIDTTGQVAFKCRYFKDRGENEEDKGQYDTPGYVFGICAAASLYRREMLEKIKTGDEFFDEDFFCYWEDVDLCWRGQLMGWEFYYNPRAVAFHIRGHSSNNIRVGKSLIFRNRILTILKNDTFKNFLRDIHHILIYEFFNLFENLFFSPSVLGNFFKCFKLLPKIFKKRNSIKSRKVVQDSDIHSWFIYNKNMYSSLIVKSFRQKFK